MCKGSNLFDFRASAGETRENCSNIGARLHGNNAELIFFINPNKEGFLIVVVDSTTFGPVAVESASLKEAVTFLEEEMVIDQLLLHLGVHAAEGVVLTLEVSLKTAKGLSDFLLNLLTLFAG